MEILEIHLKNNSQVGMTDSERSLLRSNISSYMEASEAMSHSYVRSPFINFVRHPLVVTMCSLVLLITGGSFLSYQASNSLPGDLLYPLKTNVTEKVAGTFAVTQQEKLYIQQGLITARIAEITTLKNKGDLTPAKAAVAETATASTVADFNATATKLAQNDPQTFEATKQALAPLIAKNEEDIIAVTDTTTSTTTAKPTTDSTVSNTTTPSTDTTKSAPATKDDGKTKDATVATPTKDDSAVASTSATAKTLQNIVANVQSQTTTLDSLTTPDPASTTDDTILPNQPIPQVNDTLATPIQ